MDKNYEKYVDVHRKSVVWDVQAAPEFSLEPKTWRYPFVGRLAYREVMPEQQAAHQYNDRDSSDHPLEAGILLQVIARAP